MSIKVQSYVWENSKASGSSLLLLLAIADFAHDDGTGAWPSIDTLAKKCRQTPRNVTFLLRKLEDAGELKVIVNGGPHDCNAYSIPLSSGENFSPPLNTRAQNRTPGMKTSASGGEKQESQFSPDPSGTIIEPLQKQQEPPPVVVAAVSSVKKEKNPEPARKDEKVALTFQLYQQQIGVINPRLAELVREDIEDIPLEWIPLAFDRAAAANANKWAYVKGTLQNWKAQGGPQERKNGNGPPVKQPKRYAESAVEYYKKPGESLQDCFDRLKREGKFEPDGVMWVP